MQQHFQSCGTVNRVTIRTDKFGQPKGYAYVEFLETEAVQGALSLNESELHGRQLKVNRRVSFFFCSLLFYLIFIINRLLPFFYLPHIILIFQVTAKRTNIPGMKQYRPRRSNPYMGFRGQTPFPPPFAYSPYGYGYFSCLVLTFPICFSFMLQL